MLSKLLLLTVGLILLFVISIAMISNYYPIILKWGAGTARSFGTPVKAVVYTNGKENNYIKVYKVGTYWDGRKTNSYLLRLEEFDKEGKLKFINIDLTDRWIGRPVGTSNGDHDCINGELYQSETGGHFDLFQDDMKGFSFDPQLNFNNEQITFNLSLHLLKFDSIRIELGR